MNTNTDTLKSHVQQAAGDLTDNDDLQARGKHSERKGKVKETIGDIKDKAEDAVDKVFDRSKDK